MTAMTHALPPTSCIAGRASGMQPLMVALLFALSGPVLAKAAFDSALSEDLIVQRGAVWRVSGTSETEQKITLKLGARRFDVEPKAQRWSVDIPLAPDVAGPTEISIEGGDDRRQVLIGDIWVCSGQSNMAMSTRKAADGDVIESGVESLPIRLMKVLPPRAARENGTLRWQRAGAASARAFSAVCLAFGKTLQRNAAVPIGLIDASLGGTRIEAWISKAGLPPGVALNAPGPAAAEADELPRGQKPGGGRAFDKNRASILFDTMIAPLLAIPVRGVLWYQGESNRINAPAYADLLADWMRDWRARWNNASLQFVIVQLPGFGPESVSFDPYSPMAAVRQAQRIAAAKDTHAVAVTTLDQGDDELHPPKKEVFGRLAAQAAFRRFYVGAVRAVPTVNPAATASGDRITVDLGALASCIKPTGPLTGSVQIAGADQEWHAAEAELVGHKLVARSPRVAKPVALRYAWADRPPVPLRDCDLNEALPEFRTDTWPLAKSGRPAGR